MSYKNRTDDKHPQKKHWFLKENQSFEKLSSVFAFKNLAVPNSDTPLFYISICWISKEFLTFDVCMLNWIEVTRIELNRVESNWSECNRVESNWMNRGEQIFKFDWPIWKVLGVMSSMSYLHVLAHAFNKSVDEWECPPQRPLGPRSL